MGCDEIREKLSEYLDKCLTDHQCDLVSQHIESCPACRKELEHLSFVIQAVNRLPETQAPPDFVLCVQQKIEHANMPWWQKAAGYLDRGLEAVPLRTMTAGAAAVFIFLVIMVFYQGQGPKPGSMLAFTHSAEDALPAMLPSATEPLPVEFASTRPASSQPIYLDTPTELVTAIIRRDPSFKNHQVLPHPKGVGALIHTKKHLLEVVMDPAEFPIIQAYIEQQGGQMPSTLREAKMKYPIYVRALPSPTAPLSPRP